MIKRVLGSIVVAGSLIGFIGCHHHHGRHCWGPSPDEKAEWVVKKITRKLDLNETQKSALKEVADELLDIKKQMHQQKNQTHKELLAMIKAENLESGRLLDMVETKQKVIDEKAPEIIEKLAVFHSTLNGEQKDKIANHFKKHLSDCD